MNVAIPGVVLTGSRYDVDLIVEEPLGQALVAGGLIDLTDEQLMAQMRLDLPLALWVAAACSRAFRHRSNPVRRPGP